MSTVKYVMCLAVPVWTIHGFKTEADLCYSMVEHLFRAENFF